MRWYAPVLLLAASLSGSACFWGTPAGPKAPGVIAVSVKADQRLNPDDASQSLPTVVRVLQLRSPRRLEQAEYTRVYRDPKELLTDDLLAVDELVVGPGETRDRRLERQSGAGCVAVMALFRRPTGFSWRVIKELPPGGADLSFSVLLEGYRIELR